MRLFMFRAAQIVGLSLLIAVQVACSDRYTRHFESVDDVRREGVIERGWVPSWLPQTSSNITLTYDLDTNDVWITFVLAQDSQVGLRKSLVASRVDGTVVRQPTIPWPAFLTGSLEQDEIERNGYEIFASADRRWFMALNRSDGRAYLWMLSS